MTYEEIKGLHEMGFSNEEIIKLSTVSTGNPQPDPKPEPQPAPKPDDNPLPGPEPQPAPKPDDNPLPGPKPQPEPKPEPKPDEVQQLRDEVKQLRDQLQQSNRQNMFVNSVPDDLQTQTDKIMAELIRPTIKEDKKQ